MASANVFFIAGPTASGKSAAALMLAERLGGEIVNADAMQVYADLRIITARPSVEDEARARHHLYGVLDGATRCSAGRWARLAAPIIDEINNRGAPAVVVGGTGLYFRALEEGLSPVPETPREIRDRAKRRRAELGADEFYAEVVARDPAMERLSAGDAQRQLRAWEVFETTGRPLSDYQAAPRAPLLKKPARKILMEPPRDGLYERCDARAAVMLGAGAVEEVQRLVRRGLDPDLPIMKALGVAEITAFLAGAMDRDACLAALQQSTRRFAKRQLTWFRNQTPQWPRVVDAKAALEFFLSDAA